MRDIAYEHGLFSRIEEVLVNGKNIYAHTVFTDVPLWSRFSQLVLDGEIKRFAQTKSFTAYEKENSHFKSKQLISTLLFIFSLCISMVAFLVSLVARKSVLLYSVDKVSDQKHKSDFRLNGVYEVLKKNKISHIEIFHTLLDRRLVQFFVSRRRFSFYLEAIDFVWYIWRFIFRNNRNETLKIENMQGNDDEVQFTNFIIKKYFGLKGLLEFRKKALKCILQVLKIQLFIGIDDVRHYQEILEACKELGIKTIVVQHGHFTKYHVGWLKNNTHAAARYQKADTILVWSEYWKQELIRLNSVYEDTDIVVSGYPQQKIDISFREPQPETTILIPYETEAPNEEVYKYIKAFFNRGTVSVYLKLRPDVAVEEQLQAYPKDITKYVKVIRALSEMPKPDYVLGVYSTFLYDMALLGIPILRIETSTDYGEGMVINGLAMPLSINQVSQVTKDTGFGDEKTLRQQMNMLSSDANFEKTLVNEMRRAKVL